MEFGEAFSLAVESILKQLFKPNTVCEVLSVDKDKNTCNVKETGSGKKINGVRLLAIQANPDAKFVIYPKVESLVSISYLFLRSDASVVVKYSETESILLNGDQFGGLVKAEVLKDEIDKLRTYCSSLKAATQTALVAVDGLIPGTSAAFSTSMTGKTTGDFSGIKNDNVKHG